MKLFFLLAAILLVGCSSDSTTANNNNNDDNEDSSSAGLRLNSEADFETSAIASINALIKSVTTGTCDDLPDLSSDNPVLVDGLDCDDDGGLVSHITPSRYELAVKRISLIPVSEEEAPLHLIEDTETLAQSETIEFTSEDASETLITLDPDNLVAGTYSGLEIELYYFQLTFSVAGETRNVRIYMSDDDFETEGSLGHHQGDITFINDDGTEAGWVDSTWLAENLSSSRTADQNGAGGTDAETGHDRGFFGDANLWDAESQNQGANQDIFTTNIEFDDPLEIPDPSTIENLTTITLTFSIADTFYYEDFAPQNTEDFPGFFPGDGGEASGEGAEWAPQLPLMDLEITSS